MPTKKERELIFNKFNGRCAYCGCELTKSWHCDEIVPIYRIRERVGNTNTFVYKGNCEYPERLNVDNQFPACASCNIQKGTLTLEQFRGAIAGFVRSLNLRFNQYKIAKKFGLVEETEKPVVFYFESVGYEINKEDHFTRSPAKATPHTLT